MTTKELMEFIGKKALLFTQEGLGCPVEILDAKFTWGAARLQVKPIGGVNTAWVDRSRISVTCYEEITKG